ncbi:MAG: S-layer homology domain-containing protein [Clostridiales bacterium]|nr:S-layer homology domain-containing protein [Clostridiales bacterium]
MGTTDITVDFYDTGGALYTTATVSVTVVPAAPAPPSGGSMTANITTENGATEAVPITTSGSHVSAALSPAQGNALAAGAALALTMPPVSEAASYAVTLPADSLSEDEGGTLTVNTELGSISMPSDMLSPLSGISGQTARINIGRGSVSSLPNNVKEALGDRPIVQLTMSVNGTQTDWSNPDAPVTVAIPYTPTAEESANPESIVVWYVDRDGSLNCVTNGRYDTLTGMVVFRITHFSDYAVDYNPVGFNDVDEGAWYSKAVGYLAAREITGGTGDGKFSPDAKLTRGEFIVMLMRAYGISPDDDPTDNFSDAGSTYYTGYLAAAKRLGLVDGVGNNRYAPERDITRQELFTLLYKTLTVINRVPQGDSSKAISDFSDAGDIATWAMDAVALLIETGIVEGNTGKLSPMDSGTRAEMAQMLYKLEYLMQWLQTQ